MKDSTVDVLFCDYSQTREYAESVATPEIRGAENAVLAAMGDTREHDELVTMLIAQVEKQAFGIGFKRGVRFMCECGMEVRRV